MMFFLGILLISFAVDSFGYNISCSSVANSSFQVFPEGITFPEAYKVVIRYTNWKKNLTALITEKVRSDSWQIEKQTRDGTRNYVFKKPFNATYNGTSCTAITNLTDYKLIYDLSPEISSAFNLQGFTVKDLIEGIRAKNFSTSTLQNTSIVGGIAGIDWVACDNDTIGLEVHIVYAAEHSLSPYSKAIKNPVILSMHLVSFKQTNTTSEILNHYSFDLVEFDHLPPTHEYPYIPPHLYCNGLPTVPIIPTTFPESFEATFDYKKSDGIECNIEVIYNISDRIMLYHMKIPSGANLPFTVPISLQKDTMITVLHDFKYGLQYLIFNDAERCEITGIDENFGDVELINATTKLIDLKSATKFLLDPSKTNFYQEGKHFIKDEGLVLDVYVAQQLNESSNSSSTVKLFYLSSSKNDSKPTLYSVVQYHKNSSNVLSKSSTRIRFIENPVHVRPFFSSVSSCYRFKNDYDLYINIKDTHLEDLKKIGISKVERAFIDVIANVSGVSRTRINYFSIKEIGNNVTVFFAIAEATNVAPANSRNLSKEISSSDALKSLNSTLMKGDISLPVFDKKTELKLQYLGVVPTEFRPSPAPAFSGYTGGSMFVLAFFMFFLGLGIGVGVMFVIWKKRRISGLAYQVLE